MSLIAAFGIFLLGFFLGMLVHWVYSGKKIDRSQHGW